MTRRPGSTPGVITKLGRYTDASAVVAVHLARRLVDLGESIVEAPLRGLSPADTRELARRDRERPGPGLRWFTGEESALVELLATLIVPADDGSPGAEHMDVMGRSAVDTLDRLVAGSPQRQALYGRGLLALDRLAADRYRSRFIDVSPEHQVPLLELVDRLQQTWSRPSSVAARIPTKIALLYRTPRGVFPAVELFPRLVQDVLQAFYTNRASWVWLDYDGPPMPAGYPQLLARRSSVHAAVPER